MQKQQIQFRRFIAKLEKIHGLQGWWPRLIVNKVPSTKYQVLHHPGPKLCWLSKTPSDQAFEVAVGAILTQNTAWTNVEKALVCLAQRGLMTSKSLFRARTSSIESCVRSSGYYRQKARKLKLFAKFVEEELGGDLQKILPLSKGEQEGVLAARSRLLSLWGIGPETADTILLYGLNSPIFVIDAYTRRLLVYLTGDASWHKKPYDEVCRFCEIAMGKSSVKEFQEAHALIVRWGKKKPQLRIS